MDEILRDSERCRTVIQYTKSWTLSTTPALRYPKGSKTTFLENKTEIVRRAASPPFHQQKQ